MSVNILGAGMAGLLAGKILSRTHAVQIFERQAVIPNNHSAVLRFRSNAIAVSLRYPFKEVKVLKGYVPWRNPVADSLAYSYKCTGVRRSDRSFSGFEEVKRYIAPPNFIERLAQAQKVNFGFEYEKKTYLEDPLISTIPMPALMDNLSYPHKPKFGAIHGFNLNVDLRNCEAYATLYVPDPNFYFNRISITGSRLTVEYSFPGADEEDVHNVRTTLDPIKEAAMAASFLGYDEFTEGAKFTSQTYSKILPIDEIERRRFIHWASDKFGIYSLGRYATWRPGLMLDDLLNDIDVIERLMTSEYDKLAIQARAK